MLGWPLALAFLLLVAYATFESLNIIARYGSYCQYQGNNVHAREFSLHLILFDRILCRASQATSCSSYPEVARKLLGFWVALLLEAAVVAFAVGQF